MHWEISASEAVAGPALVPQIQLCPTLGVKSTLWSLKSRLGTEEKETEQLRDGGMEGG